MPFKNVTICSPVAERCSMNFNNAMNANKKLIFENDLRFPRSSGATCYNEMPTTRSVLRATTIKSRCCRRAVKQKRPNLNTTA